MSGTKPQPRKRFRPRATERNLTEKVSQDLPVVEEVTNRVGEAMKSFLDIYCEVEDELRRTRPELFIHVKGRGHRIAEKQRRRNKTLQRAIDEGLAHHAASRQDLHTAVTEAQIVTGCADPQTEITYLEAGLALPGAVNPESAVE